QPIASHLSSPGCTRSSGTMLGRLNSSKASKARQNRSQARVVRDLPMFCHHCNTDIEVGFQFCPKCGLRLETVSLFFSRPEGRRAIGWGAAAAVILFGAGLIILALRQGQISNLKQGKRNALAYVEWLASEQPSV